MGWIFLAAGRIALYGQYTMQHRGGFVVAGIARSSL
jgi:hypothetical protein